MSLDNKFNNNYSLEEQDDGFDFASDLSKIVYILAISSAIIIGGIVYANRHSQDKQIDSKINNSQQINNYGGKK